MRLGLNLGYWGAGHDADDDGEDGDEVLDDHDGEDGDTHGVYLGLDDSDYDEEPSHTKS